MLKLLYVLVLATVVFFITASEGSSHSTAFATSSAVSSVHNAPPTVPRSSHSTATATSVAVSSVHNAPPTVPTECGGDPNAVSCDNEDICKCRDGFIFDETVGKCVIPEECPPVCGINEIYSNCSNSRCGPVTCDQQGYGIGCVKMDQKYCKGGCICKAGYLKDQNGECIPKSMCPECGGDPNAVSCDNEDICKCRDGFIYDETVGKCVIPEECPQSCGINEVYDTCANGGCRKWKCSEGTICIDPIKCEGGCVCRDKYTRAENNTCIPEDHCEKCNKPHEIYDSCAPNCPPQTCESIGKAYHCLPQALVCRGACRCEPGYYRDKNGDCIHEKQCPQYCGVNEVYDTCANGGCRKWKCSQWTICIDPIKCEGGCVCRDKYTRAHNGTCIPESQCAQSCGVNEVYDTCANGGCRRWNCAELKACKKPKRCEAGCSCKDGYTRNENGVCIPEKQCPGLCSKPHEYYDACPRRCFPQTCENIGKRNDCPAPLKTTKCEGMCMCEHGYYRNMIGECISKEDCKKCSGPHEYFSCGGACDNVCATLHKYNQTNCPIINITCNRKCYCERGYARDKNNICIPIHKCPERQCGPNERYDECPDALCSPQKCSQLGFPIDCKTSTSLTTSNSACLGKPGCVCDNGYVRDKNGKCIPPEKCPSCGGDPNAVTGCGNHCGRRCSDYKDKNTICPLYCIVNGCMCREGFVYDDNLKKCVRPKDCTPTCGVNEIFDTCANGGCRKWNCSTSILCIDHVKCKAGCSCKKGFTRARNGVCIPEDKCPERQCGPNERYEECPDALCYPQKCSQLGFPIDCNTYTSLSTSNSACPGKPGCVCDNGYVRDKNGKCIPAKKCPSCGGDPNAVAGCGVNCGRLCSNYDKGPVACIQICKINGCDCKHGFVLDENTGKCVKPKHCTPTCGVNEIFDTCANGGCRKWNCSTSILCIDHVKCKAGCSCKKGFTRNRNGVCIPEDKCPEKCTGPHEYFSCGGACDNVCATLHKYNQTNCPIINITCNRKCYCEKGYARDKNNICIPIHKCPERQCGPNERYDECPDALCYPQKCSELGFPIDCKTSTSLPTSNLACPGKPGCVCDNGYVRDKNGKCIPPEKCPSCGGDPNAVTGCGVNCGRLCSNYDKGLVACIEICKINGCDCKHGFVLDENTGKCVKPKHCTPTCGANEIFDTCANGGCRKWNCSTSILCIDHVKCKAGCSCKKGFTRNRNGVCIPEDKCPERQCGPNERYDECPDALCYPQKCSQLGFPIYCNTSTSLSTSNSACPGKPGCVCDNGYVRDKNGKCIPAKKCPSCGGDPNAVAGCGVNCGRLCSNYDKGPVACLKICKINGCDCKHGFVLDENTGKCVKPKHCTPTCGKNEVYSECINGGCERKKCSQLGKPVRCPKIKAEQCVKGCLCKEKYLRADNGTCVPEAQCKKRCTKPHEYYEVCARSCPPQTCASIGHKYHCPRKSKPCRGACRCEKGYYRNIIGECIAAKDCKKCTGPHEYFSCGKECDNVCATLHKQNQTHCPFINKTCKRMCYCEKGYARNDKNICVPIKQCQEPVCGKDEKYEDDPSILCGPLKCSDLGRPLKEVSVKNPNHNYKPACICKEGYLRDDHGFCVPKSQCKPVCGKDEKYEDDPSILCGPLKCSDLGRPLEDISVKNPDHNYKPACICKEGYLRDDHGLCVPKSQCPPCD